MFVLTTSNDWHGMVTWSHYKKDNPIPIRDVLCECSINAIIAKKFILKGPILKQSSWSSPASTEGHQNLSESMVVFLRKPFQFRE